MRRSFDGLSALVQNFVGGNPLSGHLFVFRNRSGDRLKILYWDRGGLAIWYKRLEKGTFRLPAFDGASSIELSTSDLVLLLEGIDPDTVRRQRRYEPARQPSRSK
jgi:transposase